MIFYPSCGDLNTNLKLLDDPKLFNAHFADPFHQQGFHDEHRVPADIWLDDEPRWSFTEHQLFDHFESKHKKEMGSLPKTYLSGETGLENELIWLHQKTSDSSNSNTFSNQYCPYIDTERNNNINFKSQLLNFSMKNSDCYEEEDEKENFWIPNSIQSNTMSLSNNFNTGPLLITQKSMSNEKNADDPQKRCYTSTVSKRLPYEKNDFAFAHYSDDEWKHGGIKWDEDSEPSTVLEDQQALDQQKQLQEQLQQLNNCGTTDEGEDEGDESGGNQEENEGDSEPTSKSEMLEKPDEMDTLLTFLSKFDEKVAAIWGHNNTENKNFENIIHTNPWETDCISSEFFNFQQIEDEHYNQIHENEQNLLINSVDPVPPSSALITTAAPQAPASKGKYTIMNSMKQYFGSAPPEHEYVIIKSQFTGQTGNLDLLNHSEESSSFIKFIPLTKTQTSSRDNSTSEQQQMNETASNLKDLLNNLDLDCEEEQEIIAACSKPKSSINADAPTEDLLTSWKTHFRTVIAQEILSSNSKTDCSSPVVTYGNPQLPEFRTEYNEKEYVLYQRASSTAFQVRFKLCRENEKGNQTEDFSNLADFGGIDYEGHIHLPFIEYGKQHTAWLTGQYDEECGNGLEFDWSEGRLMDSSGDSFYDDSVGLSGNNKQSKAIRRRAKGRPCKYFFMDGSCRRGNECKFSHDLITCRFWAEGSCLKGQACPFLHCFLEAKDFESHSRLSHKIDTKYQLESESDFPALGSTKLSSRVPIEDVNKVIDMLSQDDDGLSKLEDQNEKRRNTNNYYKNNKTNSI
ncbi:unnamed protein product [Allacma fusca]|uniref:C3H1-type domain-containing protein n=1 Tax=Allacma fusca TaxID=39272 RepID=A0A8J2LBZ7_9HEXA|nr:unnamed protein product [Allacma fusca]